MAQQVECDIKPLSANAFAFFSYFGDTFDAATITWADAIFAEQQTKSGQNVDKNFDIILPYWDVWNAASQKVVQFLKLKAIW